MEVWCELEPVHYKFEQFVDGLAAVVAGDLLVQMPPDSFDRVGVGRVGWQEGGVACGVPIVPNSL